MSIDLPSLATGIELALVAKQYLARDEGKRDHSLSDELCCALRNLYFTPDGVLAFLREVGRDKLSPPIGSRPL